MFAWYDFETTGTSPAYDQPLQFAAILTDDDFNEVERIDIRCRLSRHIIPSPTALAVTGVAPSQLTDPTLPSWFEFAQQLRRIVRRWAPATWAGFNNLAFDERFFRQTFYQCLQPNLYETQWNGNDRLDMLRVVYAVWELRRDALAWPIDERGQVSFRLDRVAPENGFEKHHAHDALGDVDATIHIARLVRDRAPEVWRQCLRNRSKSLVNEALETGRPLRLVERFGAHPPRSFFGCFCGRDPGNANSIGFYDLGSGDPRDLIEGSDDDIAAAVAGSPKRIRSVAVNNTPNLFDLHEPSGEQLERASRIAADDGFRTRVGEALAARFPPTEPAENIEERIYEGFYSRRDQETLAAWQGATWEDRVDLCQLFDDSRLRLLGERLVFLESPESLNETRRAAYEEALRRRWASDDGAEWTTIAAAREELVALEANGLSDNSLLAEMRAFYDRFDL